MKIDLMLREPTTKHSCAVRKALGLPLGKVFTTSKQKQLSSSDELGLGDNKASSKISKKQLELLSRGNSKEKPSKKKWQFPFFKNLSFFVKRRG